MVAKLPRGGGIWNEVERNERDTEERERETKRSGDSLRKSE